MNYIGKFITNFREFYNEINSATLTGAIDVVVIRQADGSFQCSPFHVRFGKIGVLRSREKIVDIEVNGEPVGIHMKLGESGEAFFVEEVDEDQIPVHLATSPIPPCTDIESELEKMKLEDVFSSVLSQQEVEPVESPFSDTPETEDMKKPTQIIVGKLILPEKSELSEKTLLSKPEDKVSEEMLKLEPVISSSPQKKVECVVLQHLQDIKQESSSPVRKLTTDFVPIQSQVEKQKNKKDNGTAGESAPEVITTDETSKVRRKRKRKSLNKRRPRSREVATVTEKGIQQLSESSECTDHEVIQPQPIISDIKISTSTLREEEIFQMDVDEIGCGEREHPPSMSRSISLPLSSSSLPADPLFLTDPNWRARKLSAVFGGENFHPFSDGDVTPVSSPVGSRPPSPKSDSEFERQSKHDAICQTEEEKISWGWGELPKLTPCGQATFTSTQQGASWDHSSSSLTNNLSGPSDKKPPIVQDGDKRSMLGGMLSFMRTTKKMRHAPESEGIYLDDLNPEELDPEVAALYFPKYRSLHFQSGNSPSAEKDVTKDEDTESGHGPSLPHSPHSIEGAISGLDSDSDERHSLCDFGRQFSDLEMSLCGGLMDYEGDVPCDRFSHFVVTYDDFCENPMIIQNPDVVIRMGGKYYNWQTAGPMLLSLALFQRPLPEKALSQLINEHMPKKKKKSSWWLWSRTKTSEEEMKKGSQEMPGDSEQSSGPNQDQEFKMSEMIISKPQEIIDMNNKIAERTADLCSDDELSLLENSNSGSLKRPEKYRKTLILSSEQLAQLQLKDGANEVVFSVTTAYQGTTRCKCYIYLWNHGDKIVISDIDGTITKSDVLGHILPIIGKDWAQLGVARLFTKIKNNGYQFLYLSARAIGQAKITKEYLKSVRQGDVCLPDGPLLLSPTSLINAFHREVIEKKPEVFKISCLSNIKALFKEETGNPFYAGFGNKINDTWAYRAVEIPISRIFTINHRGELKLELIQTFQSSYTRLSDVSDHVFPPLQKPSELRGHLSAAFDVPEHFSSFTYWRLPPPRISGEENLPLLLADLPPALPAAPLLLTVSGDQSNSHNTITLTTSVTISTNQHTSLTQMKNEDRNTIVKANG